MLALIGLSLAAELTQPLEEGDKRVLATLGAEPHSVAGLGYAQSLGALALGGQLTLPLNLLDGRNHRLELFARAPLWARERWLLEGRVGLQEQSASTALFRGTSLSTSASLRLGLDGERGYLVLPLSLSWNAATWQRPSEELLETWPEAQAGWLGPTGGYASAGLEGGWVFAERLELAGRVALDRSLRGGSRTAPVSAGVGLNVWL